MSKPNNSIKKIVDASTLNEYEIIPHALTDGTNLASVPTTLGADQTVVTSMDTLMIPSVPAGNGVYLLMANKVNNNLILSWKNILSSVVYLDPSTQQNKGVYYEDSGTSVPVYYSTI